MGINLSNARAGVRHRVTINHHVATDAQPGTAVGPCLVEARQFLSRGVIRVGHVLFDRSLGDAVRNCRTIGECQLVERVQGGYLI